MPAPAPDNAARPGLLPQESAIFNAWYANNYQSIQAVEFNVRVGRPDIDTTGLDPALAKMAIMNAQKRIDAIITSAGARTIVEVKFRALVQTLGQIVGYRLLWMRDNPKEPVPHLLVLCSQIDADTAYVLNTESVPFLVVAADFSHLPPISPA